MARALEALTVGWVRKSSVVAAAAVFGLVSLLFWLFLDPLLRWSFIKAGQAASGAKVDIAAVRSRLLSGRLEVNGVAVADKHEPMKNLFQFDRAVFQISPAALLRERTEIRDAEILGIQVGTARKTSGALPRSRLSRFEKAVEDQLQPVKTRALSEVGQVKQIKTEVDPKKLQCLKSLGDVRGQLSQIQQKSAAEAGIPRIQDEVRQIQKQVSALEGEGDIAAKAASAVQLQKSIKASLSDVQNARQQIAGQFASVQNGFKRADDLRREDIAGLLSQAGLPALDPQSLTRRLIGAQTAKRLSTALYWLRWLRQHEAASQAAKAAQTPPRRRGVDIEFPQQGTLPALLIERLRLSGRLSRLFQGQDMDLEGAIVGLTSNPPLYGKPTRLFLKGEALGGSSVLGLEGTLDQTHPPSDSAVVAFHYSGIPLAGSSLGDPELGADLKSGLGRVNGTLQIGGDTWSGRFLIQADGVSLAPRTTLPGQSGQLAAAALRSVRQFKAQVGIEGSGDDVRISLNSDLGQVLASSLQRALSAQLASQRQAVEAKVDALYRRQAAPLQSQSSRLQAQLKAPLDAAQVQLQDALKRSAFESIEKNLPFKGLFK